MRWMMVVLVTLLCGTVAAAPSSSSKDADADDAIVAAAEKMVKEDQSNSATKGEVGSKETTVEAAAPNGATATSEAKAEAQIPVFIKSEKLVQSESSLIWRMVASIGVILVISGAALYASRRWALARNKGGQKARIEILHQLHMGPRKSVALIRVSGEAILIGCTDHSINMLKSVALIDDELEGATNGDFNQFLEDDFSIEDVRSALGPRV